MQNPTLTYKDIANLLGYEATKQFKHFISHIRTGQIWSSISTLYNIPLLKAPNFTKDTVEKIKNLYSQNFSIEEIINYLSLENTPLIIRRIKTILSGQTYKN